MVDRLNAVLTASLSDILGPGGLLTGADDLAAYATDLRGIHRGVPAAVARPSDARQVAAVVRECSDANVPLVPQGGNTGVCGGAIPDGSGHQVVLTLERMRRIRNVDPAGRTATVEAGVPLAEVQAAAHDADCLFPLSLGSEGTCTIGGNLATNAGGANVLRYGMMRELTLGLEVVLADGRIWDGLRPLRKDNTGVDLTQVFIGSEGTLGIITAAVLKLFSPMPRRATAWVALRDLPAAIGLLNVLQESAGERLTSWELMSREAVDLVTTHVPGAVHPLPQARDSDWYGLLELAGPRSSSVDEDLERALGTAATDGMVRDATIAISAAQQARLWAVREGITEAQYADDPCIKHDISLPIAAVPDFVSDVAAILGQLMPGVRFIIYGHVGDGNLHYNLSAPVDATPESFLNQVPVLTEAIYDAVNSRGGSISAEHGLGVEKRDASARYKQRVEMDLMRTLKTAFDPVGLFNPGKVLPPHPLLRRRDDNPSSI